MALQAEEFNRRSRRFVAEVGDEDLEPIEIILEGHPPLSGEDWEEVFWVVPVAPAGVLDDLVASVVVDGQGRRKYHAPSLMAFMRGVLCTDDYLDRIEGVEADLLALPVESADTLVEAGVVPDERYERRNRERFDDLANDAERVMPIDTLGNVVVWLSDEVMGRPTSPSSGSSNGRRGNGRGSARTSKHSGSKKPRK